jgi:hypothetical protein
MSRKPEPALVQPAERVARVADQDLRHRRIAAPERDAADVGEELVGRVRVEVRTGGEIVVDAVEDAAEVVEAPVRDADRPRGEGRVAARPRLVGLLEDDDAASALTRGVGGGQAGVAGPDHDESGSSWGTWPGAYPPRAGAGVISGR